MTDSIQPVGSARATDLLRRITKTTVLVVGDLMLDRYLIGDVNRISPEAPVPIVNLTEEREVPGGAANVAANIAAMGAKCRLVGAVGEDEAGRQLREALAAYELSGEGVVAVNDRPTTTKTRILAHGQQVVRIDREVSTSLPAVLRDALIAAALHALDGCDALILEDYDKGVLDPDFIALLISAARKRKIPIVVDPKLKHFFCYAGATIFKPNRRELEQAFANPDGSLSVELEGAREKLDVEHLLITMGAEGMELISKDQKRRRVAGIPRDVFDVSGAGDTVSAWLAASMAAGAAVAEAAYLANVAASVKVGKRGTATVSAAEVERELRVED